MLESTGNIWHRHQEGFIVAITTNGYVSRKGCVMGRGTALQAKRLYPGLPHTLGNRIKETGNHVYFFPAIRVVTFPVKHHYAQQADLDLIEQSCKELVALPLPTQTVFLPRPGCGNGGLVWETVRPILSAILPDRFIILSY